MKIDWVKVNDLNELIDEICLDLKVINILMLVSILLYKLKTYILLKLKFDNFFFKTISIIKTI